MKEYQIHPLGNGNFWEQLACLLQELQVKRNYRVSGICPVCESEDCTKKEDEEVDGLIRIPVECNKCGFEFYRVYQVTFSHNEPQ